MPKPPKPPGYVYLPRAYTQQPPLQPAMGDYSVGWQYTSPVSPLPDVGLSAVTAKPATGPYPPPDIDASGNVIRFRENYHQYEYEKAVGEAPEPLPLIEDPPAVPVLLCHVCSDCGEMRSAGYHRQHPVVPGMPAVQSSCRRCVKKNRKKGKEHYSRRSVLVRTCRADDPCDWPNIDIEIGAGSRGRRHSRSRSVHIEAPRIVKRSRSRTRLGLGALQDRRRELSPRQEYGAKEENRIVYRALPDQRVFSREAEEGLPPFLYDHPQLPARGILKQPSVNRETSYRREVMMRESKDSTTVEVGGPRVQFATEAARRAEKIMSDRNRENSRRRADHAHDSENYDYYHRYETVQYPAPNHSSPSIQSFENIHIQHISPTRNYEEVLARREQSPPLRRVEGVRTREHSPAPVREYKEIRAQRISPNPPRRSVEEVRVRYPSPPSRRVSDEVRVRYVSPPPRRASPEIRIQHVSPQSRGGSPEGIEPPPQPDPSYFPHPKGRYWDQVTASDSDDSSASETVNVRRYRYVAERGEPATLVEETKTLRLEDNKLDDKYVYPYEQYEHARTYGRHPTSCREV